TFGLQNLKEGKQGSIAKRWSRRTGASVKGKIESRGVGLVYPVGGEPGAQASIARCNPQGSDESRSARVERELLAETNKINITSGLLLCVVKFSGHGGRPTGRAQSSPPSEQTTLRFKHPPGERRGSPRVSFLFCAPIRSPLRL